MKKHYLAKKVVDFESALEELKAPALYRFFSNSLEVGRSARLLETIRGHDNLSKTTLYDYASQFSYGPQYIDTVLIPRFEKWGMIETDTETVNVEIDDQKQILTKCGEFWLENRNLESRDNLAIKLICETSKIPQDEDKLKDNIYEKYNAEVVNDTVLILETLN